MPPPGIEPATPCFLACHSNHSAIGRDIDLLLELLQYFLTKRYYKNYVSCAKHISPKVNKTVQLRFKILKF